MVKGNAPSPPPHNFSLIRRHAFIIYIMILNLFSSLRGVTVFCFDLKPYNTASNRKFYKTIICFILGPSLNFTDFRFDFVFTYNCNFALMRLFVLLFFVNFYCFNIYSKRKLFHFSVCLFLFVNNFAPKDNLSVFVYK